LSTDQDMTSARSVQPELRTIRSRAVTLGRICRGRARFLLSGASEVGKNPVLIGKATFQLRGTTRIGNFFMIEGTVPVLIKVAAGASLSIGDSVYMNAGTSIEAYHELIIGNNVLMAPFASIIDDDRHQVEPGSVQYKGPTIVGSNVWLGRNVAVLPGVTIGDGAVIGANSVVTKSIPPNTFAAGSPAQVLRKLDIPENWQRL
jgi:acetyltransferase-like isoleucine patch superfamily enzyme